MSNALAADLEHILSKTEPLWEDLRRQTVLVTGATGFFGVWLVESFVWAWGRLGLGATLIALARDPSALVTKAPHLAGHPAVRLCAADVRTLTPALLRETAGPGGVSHVIHAATAASAAMIEREPLLMLETITAGTQRTLEAAKALGARRFLLTSSGAVYGPQPPELTHLPETCLRGPDPTLPGSVYAEGKRVAELLCAVYASDDFAPAIARCFAFLGPHLPLEAHFAAGNFLRDALAGGPIRVHGDGTPVRSYLYAADLAIWLWTILLRGAPYRAYNVGSEQAVSIAQLAQMVAETAEVVAPTTGNDAERARKGMIVRIARPEQPGVLPPRYVPDTRRAREELGLEEGIGLGEGIGRSWAWLCREQAGDEGGGRKLWMT